MERRSSLKNSLRMAKRFVRSQVRGNAFSSYGASSLFDGVSFGKHALVQDARNQNAPGVRSVKYDMFAALHPAEAGTNIVTRSPQHGIIGEHLTTRLKIINARDGLFFAPGTEEFSKDCQFGERVRTETSNCWTSRWLAAKSGFLQFAQFHRPRPTRLAAAPLHTADTRFPA
jgi:hypothetical protein